MKTATTVKKTKSVTVINTAKKKQRVEYNNLLSTNQQVKDYAKTFKGVRTLILSGKLDNEVTLTSFENKVLAASKARSNSKLAMWLVANCKCEADYTRKDGVKVQYSHYNSFSVLGGVRKLVNSDVLMREVEFKF